MGCLLIPLGLFFWHVGKVIKKGKNSNLKVVILMYLLDYLSHLNN